MNIYGRDPVNNNLKDKYFFKIARIANIDYFWSREPPTIRNNLKELKHTRKTEDRFGLASTISPLGPSPVTYASG